jgi:hypothetical protein
MWRSGNAAKSAKIQSDQRNAAAYQLGMGLD